MICKLSAYEIMLVIITAVVFFGGISSAYFIQEYLHEVKTAIENNYELITQIEHNLEGNVTNVNHTVAELQEQIIQEELQEQTFLQEYFKRFMNLSSF